MAKGKQKAPKQRDPVKLSKDEYLYPPSKRNLKITLIALAIAIVVAVIIFLKVPL